MKEPALTETAFACPHCGVYTSQQWFATWGAACDSTPTFPTKDMMQVFRSDPNMTSTDVAEMQQWADKYWLRKPFVETRESKYLTEQLGNLSASRCFVCRDVAVWVADRLIYPSKAVGPNPNPDLPSDIAATFQEARSIANESPRGAAALLRLCVQKLCAHLGEKGKKIDDDIKSLVAKGLSPTVQRSLDIVRVIGNEAVHPGTIDLNDDRDTALALFNLLNAIVEQMISHPKRVDSLYAKLPAEKRAAIDKRDGRK